MEASSTGADRVDVLLVGGGVASVRCARMLRRLGFDGTIAIVGDERRPPYNRPPLSKELLRDDVSDDLLAAEAPAWYERRQIRLVLDARVTALDLAAREATLSDGSRIAFGRALLATGAEPRRLDVPGGDAALTLRTAEDAHRLRRAATAVGRGAPAVVVGGGLIGVEVASALTALGLRPAVIGASPLLWGGALGVGTASWAAERLADAGVELHLDQRVTAVEARVVRASALSVPADVVVAGIGVVPRVALAAEAGLEVDGGVLVDDEGRTGHPAVWAAGDVARVRGRPRVEHWHAAREGGERVARSILGAELEPVPPAWVFTEVAGVSVDVIGESVGLDERWLDDDHRVRAFLEDETVVGLASIGGAVAPEQARRWVADRVPVDELVVRLR